MVRDYTYFSEYFILNNDYTDIPNMKPKGHGKVETKGNRGILRINLENCEKEEEYRVYILKEKDRQVKDLQLGRIITDERGRVKVDKRLNMSELEAKGFPVGEIEALIIKKDEQILLSGYIDKSSNILDRYVKTYKTEKATEEFTDPIEETIEPKVEEFNGTIELPQETQDIPETLETQYETIQEPEEPDIPIEQPDTPTHYEEEIEIPNEEYQQEYQPSNQNYEYIEYSRRESQKEKMTDYILNVLKYFPEIQPLKMYLHGYTWWRIDDYGSDAYNGFLPYYNYLLSADYKYPFMQGSITCIDLIRQYGHYLFGFYKEGSSVRYYVYAVPGKFTTEEHPFKGITGFNTWYDSIDKVGYWVLYIDPLTGKVIYPINPMIPTD